MNNKAVLRVGVYNNFNFTDRELSEVAKYQNDYIPFVNSNSFVTIKATYPSIITINPYLDSWQEPYGDLSNLKACRVKWVDGAVSAVHRAQMEAIDWCLSNSFPVLLTFMRFSCRQSLNKFVNEADLHNYTYNHSYYRLASDKCVQVLARLCEYARINYAGGEELIHTCDLKAAGCPSCGNCAKLICGDPSVPVASLSLSTSGDAGDCIFHCPDCWAKRLSKITKFKLDTVTVNTKQKGKTVHS